MTASYDKLVIDNEIIGMIMRAVEGITVDEETLAFEVLKKAGPGGHFVSNRHTRKFMRTEQYQPKLSDRNNREIWEKEGSKSLRVRASEKVREILERPETPLLSSAMLDIIRNKIPGLQSGIM
jgi:trimethylamine--corrinoid protein Co-methyltransferase